MLAGHRIVVAVLFAALAGCGAKDGAAPADVTQALGGGDTAGFARAVRVRSFHFPRDHGPHPSFRNEWWYVTGNVDTPGGRRFGFQATFFRIALQPQPVSGPSHWRARDVYMAHVALTDPQGRRFEASQRLSRAALGLAGAQTEPFRVWLEDWSLSAKHGSRLPWKLQVSEKTFGFQLNLTAASKPVLQGEQGLSRKSDRPGNASYYYSIPRLGVRGEVRIGGQTLPVSGTAWLDREWSTSALDPKQSGWDWFALQLSSDTYLMYYRLRRSGGETDPHSDGSLVTTAGKEKLGPSSVELKPLRWWTTPQGARYPVEWRMSVPSKGLELTIKPVMDDQEQHGLVRYWEGAVDVTGTARGKAISGRGYAELTGYGR